MLVKTFGSAVYGVEAITISVEVNVMNGKDYHIVGLPDSAVKESLQRVESAIKTNDFYMPPYQAGSKSCTSRYKKKWNSFRSAHCGRHTGRKRAIAKP